MQKQNTVAELFEACHRALDDLRRFDAAPIVSIGVDGNDNEAARGQALLYCWRAGEAGNAEERCYFVLLADKSATLAAARTLGKSPRS